MKVVVSQSTGLAMNTDIRWYKKTRLNKAGLLLYLQRWRQMTPSLQNYMERLNLENFFQNPNTLKNRIMHTLCLGGSTACALLKGYALFHGFVFTPLLPIHFLYIVRRTQTICAVNLIWRTLYGSAIVSFLFDAG